MTANRNYQSTWQEVLPADEIARQQAMKERLTPGLKVSLNLDGTPLGIFVYAGLWDTMHSFYPADSSQSLTGVLPESRRRYLRRDLRGREYLQLPYTLLADVIDAIIPD